MGIMAKQGVDISNVLRNNTILNTSKYGPACEPKLVLSDKKICFQGKEYLSATSALSAYIHAFEGAKQSCDSIIRRYRRNVNDLLVPKCSLQLTAERALDTGIRATEQETYLHLVKNAINSSFDILKEVDRLDKVAETLNKSRPVLRSPERQSYPEPVVNTNSPDVINDDISDIGTLTTESLISADNGLFAIPSEPILPTIVESLHPVNSHSATHVYSYRQPQLRKHDRTKSTPTVPAGKGISASRNIASNKIHHTVINHIKASEKLIPPKDFVSGSLMFKDDSGVEQLRGRASQRLASLSRRSKSRSTSAPPLFQNTHQQTVSPTPTWVKTVLDGGVGNHVSSSNNSVLKTRSKYLQPRKAPSWLDDLETHSDTTVGSTTNVVNQITNNEYARHLPAEWTNPATVPIQYSDNSDNDNPRMIRNLRLLAEANDDHIASLDLSSLHTSSPQHHTKQLPLQQERRSYDSKLIKSSTPIKKSVKRSSRRKRSQESNLKHSPQSLSKTERQLNKLLSGVYARRQKLSNSNNRRLDDYLEKEDCADSHSCDTVNIDGISSIDNKGVSYAHSQESMSHCVPDVPYRWQDKASSSYPHIDKQHQLSDRPGFIADFLKECLTEDEVAHAENRGLATGSMEALKNMLFTLQREGAHNSADSCEDSVSSCSSSISPSRRDSDRRRLLLEGATSALMGYDFVEEPGGRSLTRALVHLSRLKQLVQDYDMDTETAETIS